MAAKRSESAKHSFYCAYRGWREIPKADVSTAQILGRHGSAICRDGRDSKWRLQCKY